MKYAALTIIGYALFLIVGGVIAYSKAHSAVSLCMGIASSVILIAAAVAMLKGLSWGIWTALGVSLFLTALFGYRFFITHKVWPPGILAIISLLMAAMLLAVQKWNDK